VTWTQALDRAHSLEALDALAADAREIADRLAAELPPAATLAELAARDTVLADALGRIDAVAVRAMRLRLDHALADDTSLAAPTRKVFASTIVGYAGDVALLAQRARDVSARGGARDPADVTVRVVDAAHATFALRDQLRAAILELVRTLAVGAVPEADRQARDRTLPEAERRRWSSTRRDLEALAAEPARIAGAPMAARIAALPEQLDEPEPEPEVTFADLIELD
jgi:hypothetical protein